MWLLYLICITFEYSCCFSPALGTRSAVVSSCVFGVSAVKMQPKEKLAALVNNRRTAVQTSAALSIQVRKYMYKQVP